MRSPFQTSFSPLVRGLLFCGVLSSLLYVIIDVIGALSYPGYDYSAQAISKMSAIGTPTTDILAPWYAAWSVLFLAFTTGVWIIGRGQPQLRRGAVLMLAVAIVGTGFSLFPMNQRNAEPTLTDTMHLAIAGATMLLLSGAILVGARALGRCFRMYSTLNVIIMLAFFVLTMGDVPNVAADQPTPYMGLNERISMVAWLVWMAVFSIELLRATASRKVARG